jgi:hypothetical protein
MLSIHVCSHVQMHMLAILETVLDKRISANKTSLSHYFVDAGRPSIK